MIFNSLISILMSFVCKQDSPSYAPIKDFKTMIESPQLTTSVLNYFKNEIHKKILDIHKNSKKIKLEIQKDHCKIVKNNKVLLNEDYFWQTSPFYTSLSTWLLDLELTKEEVFSIKVDKNVPNKMREELEEVVNYLLTVGTSQFFIIEFKYDKKFFFQNIQNPNRCIRYFYRFERKLYCAYIKDYDPLKSSDYANYTMLHYFVDRVLNMKSKEDFSRSLSNFKQYLPCNESFKSNEEFFLSEAMKKISNPEKFIDMNFSKIESNNFFKCLYLLKSFKYLNKISEEYFKTLPDAEISYLTQLSCKMSICIPNDLHGNCSCGKNTINPDEDTSECDSPKNHPFKNKSLNLDSSQVSVLESFFKYILTNHKEKIMKHKEDFALIMSQEILKTLEFFFSDLKEKVEAILIFYSKRKLNPHYKLFNELYEMSEKQLSDEEKEIINKF